MFFSSTRNRAPVKGSRTRKAKSLETAHPTRLLPPVEYTFFELSKSCSEYLDVVAAMLEKLSTIELLRRMTPQKNRTPCWPFLLRCVKLQFQLAARNLVSKP